MDEVEEVAKFNLRLPKTLYDRVTARADKNRRSINNEIVVILDRVCDYEEKIEMPDLAVAEGEPAFNGPGSESVVGHIDQKRVIKPVKTAENNENVK